jgi:hypothetical protein
MSDSAPDLVLDADVLMNLFASGVASDIIRAVGVRVLVCPRVEAEALWVEGDRPGSRVSVSVDSLIAAGVAARVTVSSAEVARFVELAAQVDDGEAEAVSIASLRGVAVGTDDRRATRVAVELGVGVIDTPTLVLQWARSVVRVQEASDALARIEARARFRPGPAHPLRNRWAETREGGNR